MVFFDATALAAPQLNQTAIVSFIFYLLYFKSITKPNTGYSALAKKPTTPYPKRYV
jgi:hypothetical protein